MTEKPDKTAPTPGEKNPSTAPDEEKADAPKFRLSVTELSVGAVSAVVAAFLGSRLGVAGTLIGAAIASTTVGIVSTSLKAAVHHVKGRPKWVAVSILSTAAITFAIALVLITGKEVTTGTSLDGRPGATTVGRQVSTPSPSADASPEPTESQVPPTTTPVPEPTGTPVEPTQPPTAVATETAPPSEAPQTIVRPTQAVKPTAEPTHDAGDAG